MEVTPQYSLSIGPPVSFSLSFQHKRTRHYWATTPNTVGCYILRPFAHPFACCCVLLGVVAQSLKSVKLLASHCFAPSLKVQKAFHNMTNNGNHLPEKFLNRQTSCSGLNS